MADETISRNEVAAALETSTELGADYNNAVADAFAERLECTVDERVDALLVKRFGRAKASNPKHDTRIAALRFSMAIVSLVVAAPFTVVAVTASEPGVTVAMVWLGIAVVNTLFVLSIRR